MISNHKYMHILSQEAAREHPSFEFSVSLA